MAVHLPPDLLARLENAIESSGRSVEEVLDSRYDDVKSGRVKPLDGPAFFEEMRRREEERIRRSA